MIAGREAGWVERYDGSGNCTGVALLPIKTQPQDLSPTGARILLLGISLTLDGSLARAVATVGDGSAAQCGAGVPGGLGHQPPDPSDQVALEAADRFALGLIE